jgi:hypothetical protein
VWQCGFLALPLLRRASWLYIVAKKDSPMSHFLSLTMNRGNEVAMCMTMGRKCMQSLWALSICATKWWHGPSDTASPDSRAAELFCRDLTSFTWTTLVKEKDARIDRGNGSLNSSKRIKR